MVLLLLLQVVSSHWKTEQLPPSAHTAEKATPYWHQDNAYCCSPMFIANPPESRNGHRGAGTAKLPTPTLWSSHSKATEGRDAIRQCACANPARPIPCWE